MSRIAYIERRFNRSSLVIIQKANEICADYARQGFDLTLRQLYYQFVARGLIPNKDTEYHRLGGIINDARLAGYLDWGYIVDRTRNVRTNSHWDEPSDIVNSAARSYALDKWADQVNRVEVWIEKDALVGVIDGICRQNDVSYFSCRGYTSQSEVWAAAQRLAGHIENGQHPVIIHLGDHDPSGLDMTRDIEDRLALFLGEGDQEAGYELITINRIALNMDQVRQHNPPPNPAKLTDARAQRYIKRHGESSWELDALDPATLATLIQTNIDQYRDAEKWEAMKAREEQERTVLTKAAKRWSKVAAMLEQDDVA